MRLYLYSVNVGSAIMHDIYIYSKCCYFYIVGSVNQL